jgi:pilus assembly protein CpaB
MTDRTHRTRNLAVAAGLALFAALLTMLYVSRAEGSTKLTPRETAPVLVATKDLPIGTPVSTALATGAITVRKVAADSLSTGAVRDAGLLRGQVVVQPVFANEQITLKRFGTTGEQGMRSVLKGSLRAIAVPGDSRQLLAGLLKPGDHVDLVVNDRTNAQKPRTRVTLSNLIVLQAPGAEGTLGTPAGDGTTSAVLQLTDKQVQVLWWAVKNGDWSLVLRPSSKATVSATAPTGQRDVLLGGK